MAGGSREPIHCPLAHSRPLEGLLRQTQDDDVLLVAEPVMVGEVRQALPSRCKIIRMKSQDTRETNARLLPCLCVPGVFSHRTSPRASTRKSNRNRILSDSDSFILVVRFAACQFPDDGQVKCKHRNATKVASEHATRSNTSASRHHI